MLTISPRSLRIVTLFAGVALTACPDATGDVTDSSSGTTPATEDTGESTGGTSEASTTGAPTTGEAMTEPTTGSTTGGEPLTRVEQILAALGVSMYTCPDRIWPDVMTSYRARQVLLASVVENRAWLWNDQIGDKAPPSVTEGPLDSLPAEWTAYFNVGVLQGVATLGVSLDETAEANDSIMMNGGAVWPDFAVSLAFHEAFHFLSGQDDWNVGNGSRTAPYPEPWQPRYLRAALLTALQGEVLGQGAGLDAAAYWQGRLLAEHSEEMKASARYDITEGTAEYATILMSALAELGCEASDAELLATAKSHLDGFLGLGQYDPGREFYDTGLLSGLLLREQAVDGWELEVEGGTPPVEVLLAGATATPQPDDPALQADVQGIVATRNEAVGMEIEPMLDHMKSADYTRIAVSLNWLAGSFNVGGFYYLVDEPTQPEVFLRFSAVLDPPSGVAITVEGLTSLVGVNSPCALAGSNTVVLAIPTADVAVAGGKATATSPRLSFADLEVEATVDLDNLPWLCPVDAGGAGNAPPAEPGPVLDQIRLLPGAPGQSGPVRWRAR